MNNSIKDQTYKVGYDAGVKIACALRQVSPNDVLRKAAFVDTALADLTIQTALCKVASHIFERAGMTYTPEYILYSKLSNMPCTLTQYSTEKFLVPVVKTLQKAASVAYEIGMEKVAAGFMLPSIVAKLVGRTAATTPEVLRLLSIIGIGGGAAAGSLAWLLNRDSTQDETDVEAKLKQAEHYKQIAKDLQKRLDLEADEKPSKKDLKKAVEEQGEGAYLI